MSNDTRDVKLTKIILDYSKQVRVAIDYDVVREYAEKMAAGKVLPPIDLFRAPVESAGFLIGDGWHRILAAKENKADLIAARIHDGDPNEALKFALGANQEHGIRRTNADKRNAVELALQVFGNMSDRQIAELCGVHHELVAKYRPQLAETPVPPGPRLGSDGKLRRMPVRTAKPDEPPAVWKNPTVISARKDYQMPNRGLFLARGVIAELKKIQEYDGERIEAFTLVADFCMSKLPNPPAHDPDQAPADHGQEDDPAPAVLGEPRKGPS